MRVTLWGTRGSIPAPGADTARYGGNTSCVLVTADDGRSLVLDAGSGIRLLGGQLMRSAERVDLLLTHLHLDHLQGLGFFAPLYVPGREVHIWGPPSTTQSLVQRLRRYMAPPLFPVRLRDLPCRLTVHELTAERFDLGPFAVEVGLVCHPGPTLGYRISADGQTLSYLPDHEPALGVSGPLLRRGWTSGHRLAARANLLIHDAQYDDAEYGARVGWGHSTVARALEFAELVEAQRLVLFHHDPSHDDARLDRLAASLGGAGERLPVVCGAEGASFDLSAP